jgi:hypothetical protein
VFGGECYGHDYGSYGHEAGDVLWWYDNGTLYTGDPERVHDEILNDWDEDFQTDDFIRGRYSPVAETISLIPALMDDCTTLDYNVPREVFMALEEEFPEATTVEIF